MVAARAAAVGVLSVLATVAVHGLLTGPLTLLARAGAAALATRDPGALRLPLEELVLSGAALALAVCWAWLLLGVAAAAVGAVTSRRLRLGPRWVHTVIALALGVTAVQTPAVAEPTGERAAPRPPVGTLSGLPLPERVAAESSSTPGPAHRGPAPSTVRVRPGDSLWSIAAALLPPGASPADVDRAWRRVAAANADVLGTDPDLIFPGTLLRVPPLDRPLGKERP